jgi:hypothetical protein
MNTKKKQHFVPQLHLERFTYDGNHLHVYDKFSQKAFTTNKRDVAEENAFYNIPDELITDDFAKAGIYPQMVEDLLSNIEGRYQTALRDLLATPENGTIDDEVKGRMCYFLTLQILRTRDVRNLAREMQTKFLQALVDDMTKLNFPEHSHLSPRVEMKHDVIAHLKLMLDPRIVAPICDVLSANIWLIGLNKSGTSLITSDTPIVKCNHIKHKYAAGWAGPGVEILFPISPNHALILLDRQTFVENLPNDGRWVNLTKDDITRFNEFQVINSHRQVFSSTPDFHLVERMCKERPELCSPRENRVTINLFDKASDKPGQIKKDLEMLIAPSD